MDIHDYYNILGCTIESSHNDIKQAYYALARQFHPDKNSVSKTISDFQLISKAWSILGNPDLKKQYDIECRQAKLEFDSLPVYAVIMLDELKKSDDTNILTYPCRCGCNYTVHKENLQEKNSSIYVSCEECSFVISIKT